METALQGQFTTLQNMWVEGTLYPKQGMMEGDNDTSIEYLEAMVFDEIYSYLNRNGIESVLNKNNAFGEFSLDSLDLMKISMSISGRIEKKIPPTSLIDYPTITSFCEYLHSLMVSDLKKGEFFQLSTSGMVIFLSLSFMLPWIADSSITEAKVEKYFCNTIQTDECPYPTIHVAAFAHRMPGRSTVTHQGIFTDKIDRIPICRWDIDDERQGNRYNIPQIRFAGFLSNIDSFDAAAWRMTPSEAQSVDPQQRLLLENVLSIVLAQDMILSQSTGVFIGASSSEYQYMIYNNTVRSGAPCTYGAIGGALSALAGRISFHMGLQGPSLVIDTACSSSLVSIGICIQSMRENDLSTSLSASTNTLLVPEGFVMFAAAGMLSSSGRCRTLDSHADGYGRAEAVTSFLLENASNAAMGEQKILLSSVAINQDGRSSSLTAPNGPAQAQLIRQALTFSSLAPSNVQSLMLHGTGTPLGDPIEIHAGFQALFHGPRLVPLELEATKTIIGHTEPTSGAISLLYALIKVQHGQSIFNQHLGALSDHITQLFDSHGDPPIHVARQHKANNNRADDGIVSISSFASQGTNAHAILRSTHSPDLQDCTTCPKLWTKGSMWISHLPVGCEKFINKHQILGSRLIFSLYQSSFASSKQYPDGYILCVSSVRA